MKFKTINNNRILGKVILGKQLGRTFNIPTANIVIKNGLFETGVYISQIEIYGVLYNSISNVGVSPTFSDDNILKVETHIFDFSSDIYDLDVEVFLIEKIRDEINFNSVDEFLSQVRKDIEFSKRYFKVVKK